MTAEQWPDVFRSIWGQHHFSKQPAVDAFQAEIMNERSGAPGSTHEIIAACRDISERRIEERKPDDFPPGATEIAKRILHNRKVANVRESRPSTPSPEARYPAGHLAIEDKPSDGMKTCGHCTSFDESGGASRGGHCLNEINVCVRPADGFKFQPYTYSGKGCPQFKRR